MSQAVQLRSPTHMTDNRRHHVRRSLRLKPELDLTHCVPFPYCLTTYGGRGLGKSRERPGGGGAWPLVLALWRETASGGLSKRRWVMLAEGQNQALHHSPAPKHRRHSKRCPGHLHTAHFRRTCKRAKWGATQEMSCHGPQPPLDARCDVHIAMPLSHWNSTDNAVEPPAKKGEWPRLGAADQPMGPI